MSEKSAACVAPKNGYAVLLKSVAGIDISVIGTDVYVRASTPVTFIGYFGAQVLQIAIGIFKCSHIITEFADKVSESAVLGESQMTRSVMKRYDESGETTLQ